MHKLKDSTETILVFDSYTDKLEYSLKVQERSDRAGSTPPLQMHIGEICHETLQDINYQEFLSNSEDKSPLLKKFTEYLTQESTRKDSMGCTTLNIEKDTVLISQSQQKIIFTSTQEEADTRIAIHCTESSKPVLVKAKYTDILILMVCVFALTSPPYG